MPPEVVSAIPQLGVAGVAIWVMYLMYKISDARFQEKDITLMKQVEKHEETLRRHQDYMAKVQESTMTQLNHASRVIEDNVKAYERVIKHLDNHLN